ncbi:MAG: hypothetical protein K1X94_03270 [Sandaracinaceae bacterium]|nr:hypothetical protein [Sandaracinaceae bacterium]
MTDEEHVEQLRVRLSAAIETRKTIVAGRTLGALTVEELRKVADLDDREIELHREIDATQRRAAQSAQKEAPVAAEEIKTLRARIEAREKQREAMVRGRRSGDLTPSEAWDIATTSSDDDEADRRALARLEGAQPGAGELNLAQLEHRQREQLLAERAGRRERLIQLNRQREQDEPA